MGEYTRKSGIVAACILGLVTLSVFFVLQFYGPESVVRQLHRVASRSGLSGARSLLFVNAAATADFRSYALIEEERVIRSAAGGAVDIRMPMPPKTVNGQRRAQVAVTYFTRDGSQITLPWVVIKFQRRWLVDVVATRQLWSNPMMDISQF